MARQKLYAAIAQDFANSITAGNFISGDKLPSLREIMAARGVSQSTAMRAMIELEGRGLVVARPRSGYIVSPRSQERGQPESSGLAPTAPAPESAAEPTAVAIKGLIGELFDAFARPDLISLGVAELDPALIPSAALTAAARAAERRYGASVYRKPDVRGLEDLRRSVSRQLARKGVQTSPDEIIITSSQASAMALALRTVIPNGGVVAVESPTYFGILRELEGVGAQVIEIAADPQDGLDVAALIRLADRRRLDAVVLNPVFSNPFGSLMPPQAMRLLTAAMADRGVPVIEDDVYSDLSFDGRVPPALASFDRSGNVLYCGSFSKTVSPALRIGWCWPGKRFGAALAVQKAHAPTTAAPQQFALACFMQGRRYSQHTTRLRDLFASQDAQIRSAIHGAFPPGTAASSPKGGFLYWVRVPAPFEAMRFYREALDIGVSIAPGPLFSATRRYSNCIRLSFGLRMSDKIFGAIEALGQLARKM